MPTNAEYSQIKQALQKWQNTAEDSLKAGNSPAVPHQSPIIPDHVREYLEAKLPKAESLYRIGVYFQEAIEMAKYPAGFESPHPAYLAYKGPGIPATEHVQNHLFDFKWPRCRSLKHVTVLSSEWGGQHHEW